MRPIQRTPLLGTLVLGAASLAGTQARALPALPPVQLYDQDAEYQRIKADPHPSSEPDGIETVIMASLMGAGYAAMLFGGIGMTIRDYRSSTPNDPEP